MIFHSNATYLIEPEAKEWAPFPWCRVHGVKQVNSGLGSVEFSHQCRQRNQLSYPISLWVLGVQAARRSARLLPIRMFCFKELHGQKLHILKFPYRTLNLSASLLKFLLSNRSLQTVFVILEVVLIIPFIHFFPEINSSSFLHFFFFSLQVCTPQLCLGYESLKSLCCGNIFFNNMPCVFSFLFI